MLYRTCETVIIPVLQEERERDEKKYFLYICIKNIKNIYILYFIKYIAVYNIIIIIEFPFSMVCGTNLLKHISYTISDNVQKGLSYIQKKLSKYNKGYEQLLLYFFTRLPDQFFRLNVAAFFQFGH